MKLWTRCATAVVIAAAMLIPLAGPAAAASPARYGAPHAGRCYDIGGKAASRAAISAGTVACLKRHTLWVLAVHTVPKSVVAGQGNGAMTHRTARYYYKDCIPAIRKALGSVGTRFALSAYESFWFLPTKAQQAKGAHWLDCALGIAAGKRIVHTSSVRPQKVTGSLPNRLRLCGTPTYYATTCAAAHVYRSTYARTVHRSPTTNHERTVADQVCPSHVQSARWMYYATPVAAKRFLLACLTGTTH